jgi:hypothetical protein
VEPVLIGYFAKRVTAKPDSIHAPAVLEICSVSECIAPGPDGWADTWTHNEQWVYDTRSAARALVPPEEQHDFALYAYRLLPVLFREGSEEPFEVPSNPSSLPSTFESLGFDVVSRCFGTSFECSPLSCSDMAHALEANQYCLLSTLSRAIEVAVKFSLEQPEPGPYFVVEVLRERSERPPE